MFPTMNSQELDRYFEQLDQSLEMKETYLLIQLVLAGEDITDLA